MNIDTDERSRLEDIGLTEKQIQGISKFWRGIAEGWDYEEIAMEIGISPKTLWRWRQQDKFWDGIKHIYDQSLMELLPKVVDNFSQQLDKNNKTSVEVAKQILRATGLADRDNARDDTPEPLKIIKPDPQEEEANA